MKGHGSENRGHVPHESNADFPYNYIIFLNDGLTLAACAIKYVNLGMPIFPLDGKVPIKDLGLGFTNGFRSATTDLKKVAKTWWKYPNAGIGYAIPPDIQIFDLDVAKDPDGNRILLEGRPVHTGVKSFQNLILDLNLADEALGTLITKTQSDGCHIWYRMPPGISSFNRTSVMDGLDLKGCGGYVVLPLSPGKYGHYEFMNRAPVRMIPDALLNWILQLKKENSGASITPVSQDVDDPRVLEFANEIMEAWNAAIRQHRGNEMRLAIVGTLFHYGWPQGQAEKAMRLIIGKSDVKGLSDREAVRYTYNRGAAGLPVSGFSTLKKIIEELEVKQ